MEIYRPLRQRVMDSLKNQERGDPQATAAAMLKLVDADAPPLRLILGNRNLPAARSAYAGRIAEWEARAGVSNAAQGEPGQ